MIKIGFIMPFSGQYWLGGIHYFKNLLNAICSLPNRKIEPVIFTGCKANLSSSNKDFLPFQIIKTPLLDKKCPQWFFRKLWAKILFHDLFLERLLQKNNINILSHSAPLGKHSNILTIGWIPDFQHLYLPEFFSKKDIKLRNQKFKDMLLHCSQVIVSSNTAKQDLIKFDSTKISKVSVLQFVADPGSLSDLPHLSYLEKYYQFQGPYFHLPNQFWIHKNHRIVIEALRILKMRNQKVLVFATGNTNDVRQPNYFKSLMKYAKECNVLDCFRILGIIPYNDLVALMINSVSLINPSLFEGWSTTVEEAKSLGKHILLSDIAIHREQAPERGIFFDPFNAELLANKILELQSSWDVYEEHKFMEIAYQSLFKRKINFAREYENIIANLL